MINESDLSAWEYYKEVNKPMNMNAYQEMASKTAIYSSAHQILYPALGLVGEAGEVANKVKKMMRDGTFDRAAVVSELGDVMWYIAALCRDLNVEMNDVALDNLKKLYDRMQRGTIQGNGDTR